MGSASQSQKQCSRKFNTVCKQKAAIAHWNSMWNISQQSTTKNYHEGVPPITVVVDGGWSKRSHRHSYNANSGVGVIFGTATKKLLYIGVRNKYCVVCSSAQKHSSPLPQHMCLKNWSCSFTAMEADIIAACFATVRSNAWSEVHGSDW